LRCSHTKLVETLHGRVADHHRFMLRQHFRMVEDLKRSVSEFDRRIEAARFATTSCG